MGQVDLHVHSTASDGRYPPAEVVRRAAKAGLTVLALADHDSVDGIPLAFEAARAFPRLKIIPAVEVSTDTKNGEVHILGYFIDYNSHELKANLERFRNSRLLRGQRMVEKLSNLGILIEWPRVQAIAGSGVVGRPHVARAMLEKGYIKSMHEAFEKYIGFGGPAYVEREKMTPREAVGLLVRVGGLPVLAHPYTLEEPEGMVLELKQAGLVGIEAYYAGYTAPQISQLVSLAAKYDLLTTGGSDYHGLEDGSEPALGSANVPMPSVTRLINLSKNPRTKPAER